jgi:SAM-dependent methyltransferase
MSAFFGSDLSYIHDVGFGGYARRLAPEVVALLQRRIPAERDRRPAVVELGCGAGTIARRLMAAGFDVIGIDISPAMVRMARVRVPAATFRVGSWTTWRVPRCAAVLAIGEIVSYVPPRHPTDAKMHERELRDLFARAYSALIPGGLLVFDFVASPEGRTFESKRLSGRDWTIRMRSRADRRGALLTRQLELTRRVNGRARRSREVHHVRIYRPASMAAMLSAAGFDVTLSGRIGRTPVFRSTLAAVCCKPGGPPEGGHY